MLEQQNEVIDQTDVDDESLPVVDNSLFSAIQNVDTLSRVVENYAASTQRRLQDHDENFTALTTVGKRQLETLSALSSELLVLRGRTDALRRECNRCYLLVALLAASFVVKLFV